MTTEIITKNIQELLDLLGVEYDAVVIEEDQDIRSDFFKIQMKDAGVLLGRGGEALSALNYIIRKQHENRVGIEEMKRSRPFFIDVNNYKQRKIQDLKTKARIMADRVRSFGTDMELEPMPAYERLIIHSFLTDQSDVTTESTGVGRERRIVIKHTPVEKY